MPTANRAKQVCLFGLSGDPPTGESGHVGIVKALSELDFDQIRVLPVYRHTFAVSERNYVHFAIQRARVINQVTFYIIGEAKTVGIV